MPYESAVFCLTVPFNNLLNAKLEIQHEYHKNGSILFPVDEYL